MTQSLGFINARLADAEEKQQNQDRVVQEWLKRLEEVAYDAQNVLDELHYESLRHQVESRNRPKRKVCCFFSFSNINLAFRWRMASKVRDINLELNKINKEANRLELVSRLVMTAALPAAVGDTRNRQTDSVLVPMTGRADDELNIVKMLLRPSEKVVSVLPITGMGGLGKTTLAKSIYNNKQIDGQFEKKLWVCVSKKVPVVELFKLILGQLTEDKDEVGDRNVIVGKIGNNLGGKRCLLVLDDVWDDDQALWDDFFTTLKGLNPTNGSWCLVTTRLGLVAHSVSGALLMENEPYALGRLPDDHCWSILKEKAVRGQEEPDVLKAIKERVIKRCDGLPLAASVIGGLLRLKRKEEWRSILENRLLSLSGDGDRVMQILQLSFDNLPSPAIKKCFAYCSIFPNDAEMEGDMLIELWMAEGFLQVDLKNRTMVNKTMEVIGEYYLEILLQSSLLEEIRDDGERYYKMHDMVHDLAESMSKSTKVINDWDAHVVDNGNHIRYLAIDSSGGREDREKLLESLSTSLHTLFIVNGDLSGDMLMKLKNLYVLNLSRTRTRELPVSIGKLIHLRYVNLERSAISILPDSLCKLYNLQTLTLSDSEVKDLPKGMRDLISLRHLHYYTKDEEFQMPLEMGRLTCLQTLEFFNMGREKGRRIEELGSLKNLKGKLEIRNLELVKDKEGAEEAKLSEKANLFRLQLEWARDREGDNYNDEDVLDGLRPHPNLEELAIWYFLGDEFPRWLMDLPTTTALPESATTLQFNHCNRCRELLPLQNFASLKQLEIYACDGLTNLPGDMLHSCASLQKLEVSWCDNLISFPLNLQQTPSLLELELYRCPKLKTSLTPKGFGFLTSLRELVIGPFSDDGDDHENSSIYNEFDWSGLISSSSSSSSSALRRLVLIGLPHMESLPPQIQHLTTLTSLELYNFGGIKALPDWFGNFAALKKLHLHGFEELGHLPSEDAMRKQRPRLPVVQSFSHSRPRHTLINNQLSSLDQIQSLTLAQSSTGNLQWHVIPNYRPYIFENCIEPYLVSVGLKCLWCLQ
ncbi:unnamed protein product [Coffea canephora]|uniref:DH200=94 genomic scaffold, scaffold_645 n=1 Tax=Coffea canephora TaxID=49390 RepID=A0A068VG15_COFCA|nr:unnamed protein product [Coffea canephora]